eukprot:151984-Chlamydomonas_euryale.AAC.2
MQASTACMSSASKPCRLTLLAILVCLEACVERGRGVHLGFRAGLCGGSLCNAQLGSEAGVHAWV